MLHYLTSHLLLAPISILHCLSSLPTKPSSKPNMRLTLPLYTTVLVVGVSASSWFGSDYEYTKWSPSELRTWLADHNIKTPSSFSQSHLHDLVAANWANPPSPPPSYADQSRAYADAGRQWSYDQYSRAQHTFQDLKDGSFDKWDESRLREFLLEQGVVAPSGPREQLVILAKQKYNSYTDAAAYYSSLASASASSAYSGATDTAYSASKSVGSIAAQATREVGRAFDDTKDYVYSTWDDNRLRSWLEDKGVVEAKKAKTRSDLLGLMRDYYRKAADPVWDTWTDSYMREWLISHNLLSPSDTASRSTLVGQMKKYYYNSSDSVWSSWSDSDLKTWLVQHGIIKSDTKKKREELVGLIENNYASASDSVWGAWSDSDMHAWLKEHGYIDDRSETAKKREELVQLIDKKYNDATARSASYLVWPDARLRAYLRERGVSETALPTSRPGLLQETRIRWVQTSNRAETIFAKLKEIVNGGVEAAEEKLARVLEVLSGASHDTSRYANEKAGDAKGYKDSAWSWGSHKANDAKGYAEEKKDSTWGWGSQKADQARGAADDAKDYADEKKDSAWHWGSHKADQARGAADDARDYADEKKDSAWHWGSNKADQARDAQGYAGEKVRDAKGYANEKAEEAKGYGEGYRRSAGEGVKSAGEGIKKGGEKVKSAGDEL
ncbi:hypothetical protein BV22DRAFT_1111238 [Leucogyrophana mollusca]|uniref:Uncharacterized protein n=1 Tax=Leucogyrophana mollusca TaxID=85980 RepID=A0ACB8BPL4_9AGAM|nr:hypothetical protein BV22DRAFT_1111238 [Leucogyrophana mollusca]